MGFGVGALGFLSLLCLEFLESLLDRRPFDGVLLPVLPSLGDLGSSVDARKADFAGLFFLLGGRLIEVFDLLLLELLLM